MAKSKKTYDVVISYATGDAPFAGDVANACRINGLETFSIQDLPHGAKFGDTTREAIAESRALITILSPTGPTSSMYIEIGAARMWNKPIFAIITNPSSPARLPVALSDTPVYSIGRLDDVITAIKANGDELNDDDRAILAKLYSESGLPMDQLIQEPGILRRIVEKFHAATGKVIKEERLLSEMLRMRKQGRLKLTRPQGIAKRRHGIK